MDVLQYTLRKLLAGIPLVLGVTLISFLLIVYFGPDQTYELLGKNPTAEEIAEVRSQLGYDRPFVTRYLEYLREIVTLDFGSSQSTDEKISRILARTIPVSLALALARLHPRQPARRNAGAARCLLPRPLGGQVHHGRCGGRHVDQLSDCHHCVPDHPVVQ